MDLSEIPYGLVHIWHGTAYKNVPVRNAYKNAEAISGAHLEIFENAGHLLVLRNLEKLGEILSSWMHAFFMCVRYYFPNWNAFQRRS